MRCSLLRRSRLVSVSLLSSWIATSSKRDRRISCRPLSRCSRRQAGPHARLHTLRYRAPIGIRTRTLHLCQQTVAVEGATGEVVGSAHVWNEGEKYTNIGIIVVAEEHRGQALESRLLREAIFNANAIDRWLVHAANPVRLPLFASEGFERVIEIHRQHGIVKTALQPPPISGIVREATEMEHEEIYALDRSVTPGRDRTELLRVAVSSGGPIVKVGGRLFLHRETESSPIDGFAFTGRGEGAVVVRPVVAASRTSQLPSSPLRYSRATPIRRPASLVTVR